MGVLILKGMGLHQAPLEGTPEEIEASHFHIHFYPPLLRSATVRKFLVGSVKSSLFMIKFAASDITIVTNYWQSPNATSHRSRLRRVCGSVEPSCIVRIWIDESRDMEEIHHTFRQIGIS